MEFEVQFYKDNFGKSNAEEFLLSLVRTNKILFNKAAKAIEKLKYQIYHKEPLSKYLESRQQKTPINELEIARKRLKNLRERILS